MPVNRHIFHDDRNFTVKIANTTEEVDAALKLRFEVFNLELLEGLESSYKSLRDEDVYDTHCYHLIIIQKKTGNILGTYRVQTREMARKGMGFYSANEFQLNSLSRKILNNAVELGRACIHKGFRNSIILFLLWKGIYKFMQLNTKQYLFGCCSIKSQDPVDGIRMLSMLRESGHLHKKYMVKANSACACYFPAGYDCVKKDIELPELMNVYFRYKAKICSYPAIDRDFKTIDFLMLLNIKDVDEPVLNKFL